MADTRECLASLEALAPPPAGIVVVTNGREDFDEASAREVCPRLTVVPSPVNLGYGGGCNLGARSLAVAAVDVLLFLNNDTVVAPGLLAPIVAAFEARPGTGIVAPVVMYYDDPTRIWSAGGFVHPLLGYTRHHGYGARKLPSAERGVDFVSGCALAVRRTLFERLGGFDESYFHYFEDVDLCARAQAAGQDVLTIPVASVRHKVSAAAGERGTDRLNRTQAYYFSRNRVLFVRRDFTGVRRIVALASQALVLLPYELAKAAARGNWPEARGRLEGVIDGLRGRRGQRDLSS
jgi:GT2 family glycosyltransferase